MTNETKPLKLRGHHIGVFAINYFGDDFYEPKQHKLVSTEDKDICGIRELERKIEKDIKKRKDTQRLSEEKDFIDLYGKEMKNNIDTLWYTLKTQPDIEVEIVEGLDSICMADCPRRNASCANIEPDGEDTYILEQYELEAGQVYTAGEIMQRIKDFTLKTRLISPRELFEFRNSIKILVR